MEAGVQPPQQPRIAAASNHGSPVVVVDGVVIEAPVYKIQVNYEPWREENGKRRWWRERKRKGNHARVFNQGLVNHVLSNKGTPLRPNSPPMDIYIFSLLDEGAKSILSESFERHWGIFYFDGKAKYPLNLGLGNKELKNAKNVEYLPSRWCVASPSSDMSNVANHMRIAYNVAECTTLNYGGSCNGIGEKGNISYSFNSYYQLQL
ncbi:hypothetical protein PIB30_003093 [Stylosanthes scabra]|uniref:glucan endo-1,3-beta-D-glucosidase n=1 Tax=Stylosanthes scabra TaxID=79078 RepID=A0ABU6Y2Q2_9FABA|nr:hypothetical protein [Stylosanthes scabra]